MKINDWLLEHNGQQYPVKTWKIGEGTSIGFSSGEVIYKDNVIKALQELETATKSNVK